MRALLRAIVGSTILATVAMSAQMHKVAKPQQVVRAIGVYEWTGDFAKPTASRLIPVSLYIEGKFEDAGIYIARPIPFALLPGNLYILQTAGIDKGTLDLAYAKHLQAVEATGDLAWDDGWFGYGSVRPLAAPRRTTTALKPSKTLPVLTTGSDPNHPHLSSKPADPTSTTTTGQTKSDSTTTSSTTSTDPDRPTMARRTPNSTSSGTDTSTASTTTPSTTSSTSSGTTGTTPADDPDRPTMKRRTPDTTSSGTDASTTAPTTSSTTSSTGTTPADDPDRPTMQRRTPDSTSSGTDTTTASNNPAPDNDPDRPTLKRHTPEDARKASASGNDIGSSSGASASLNDDPNRPNLHHGKPTGSMTEADLPKLTGLPSNLHQMVAVSDAVNRDPHPFTLDWEDEAQHQAILHKMQDLARAQLTAYGSTPATTPATPAKKPATSTTTTHRTTKTPPPPPTPLFDEDLKAYTLSYGGDPTYIYSANTGGTGAALRYVTIVAQADPLGEIKPAIQSVTDAAHLDRSPKMQFVDVVDAEASNRASLLFELRSKNARQFALYRVIASHPEQIFLTGTTQ
jgi:hypothetical protein